MSSSEETQDSHEVIEELTAILGKKFGDRMDGFLIPPPVFTYMEGEFIEYNQDEAWLKARFPIKREYLNPYKVMQGGMIAAAIDNTLGPLSMLIAPANVTRTLEVKYSSPVSQDYEVILVHAKLIDRKKHELIFTAEVRAGSGQLLARARARHWITALD